MPRGTRGRSVVPDDRSMDRSRAHVRPFARWPAASGGAGARWAYEASSVGAAGAPGRSRRRSSAAPGTQDPIGRAVGTGSLGGRPVVRAAGDGTPRRRHAGAIALDAATHRGPCTFRPWGIEVCTGVREVEASFFSARDGFHRTRPGAGGLRNGAFPTGASGRISPHREPRPARVRSGRFPRSRAAKPSNRPRAFATARPTVRAARRLRSGARGGGPASPFGDADRGGYSPFTPQPGLPLTEPPRRPPGPTPTAAPPRRRPPPDARAPSCRRRLQACRRCARAFVPC